ncbi:hypothetical protein SAMN04488038_10860 [Solimonas aquatica]|uniref:Lipoprotein n=1 Tax=Solimonas aquatica TaxID=489703 RepID=A0A1H9H859_9GAMM|nr:hypothetical protein [Solimonas aquatica]SEQ58453.1 hypothetical protein SAMN04488038_10860 [Solimonas aquatica]
MRAPVLIALCGALLLSACSANRRCAGTPSYQKEDTLPAPGAVEGLTVPTSPSALSIPAQPAQSEPFGKKVKDADGRSRYECLDVPPPFNPPPAPAASEKAPKS